MNISLLFLWQILKSDPNGPDPFLFFKYSFVQTPDPGIRIFFRYVRQATAKLFWNKENYARYIREVVKLDYFDIFNQIGQ